MDEPHYHQMRLEKSHPSGAEEWYCPTCGRRLFLHWPPEYKRPILEPGDTYAVHSGSKGSGDVDKGQAVSTGATASSLRQWEEWLADIDMSDL